MNIRETCLLPYSTADTQRDIYEKRLVRHSATSICFYSCSFFYFTKLNNLFIVLQNKSYSFTRLPIDIKFYLSAPGFTANENGVRILAARLASFKLPTETNK